MPTAIGFESLPFHPFGTLLRIWGNLPQLLSQATDLGNCVAQIRRKFLRNLPSNNIGQLWAISIRADHNLQRTISVNASEIKVTLWWDIGNIHGYPLFLA